MQFTKNRWCGQGLVCSVIFGTLLNPGELGNLTLIGAVSFLWNGVEQKDLAD